MSVIKIMFNLDTKSTDKAQLKLGSKKIDTIDNL